MNTPTSAESVPRLDTPPGQEHCNAQGLDPVPVWPSDRLLGGQKVVAIEHNGALYRLQSTRAGKLILTK